MNWFEGEGAPTHAVSQSVTLLLKRIMLGIGMAGDSDRLGLHFGSLAFAGAGGELSLDDNTGSDAERENVALVVG